MSSDVASVFDRFAGRYMVVALSFSPILKIGPVRTPATSWIDARSRTGHRAVRLSLAPARCARCSGTSCHRVQSRRPPRERVGDGLQRRGACLPYLLYNRQHRACEALGLSLAGLATAAADSIEVRVAQLQASQKSVQNAAMRRQGKRPGLRHGGELCARHTRASRMADSQNLNVPVRRETGGILNAPR